MNTLNEKLKRLRNEDMIWIIYFFIAGFALWSNHLDREFLFKKDVKYYYQEKKINIAIFIVAFFIYLYFLLQIAGDLNNLKNKFNEEKFRLTFIQLIGAILFLIAGAIYIYVEANSNDAEDVGVI